MLDQSFEHTAFPAPRKEGKLGDIAYSQIYDAIMDCRLKPGEVFREASLCEQFGLRLAPTRGALARLGHAGLVRSEKRRGWRVLEISGRHLSDLSLGRELLEPALAQCGFDRQFAGEFAMRARIVAAQLGGGPASPQAIRLELSLLRHLAAALREQRVRRWLVETWDLCARADTHFITVTGMRRETLDVERIAAAVAANDTAALETELRLGREAFRARSAEALAGSATAIVAETTPERPETRQSTWSGERTDIAPTSLRPSQSTQGEDR